MYVQVVGLLWMENLDGGALEERGGMDGDKNGTCWVWQGRTPLFPFGEADRRFGDLAGRHA